MLNINKTSFSVVICLIYCLLLTACSGKQMANERTDENIQVTEQTVSDEEAAVSKEYLSADTKTVVIPEVKREYEIWFFSDSHIIIPDENASEQVQAYTTERQPVFVNEMGVDSSKIFTDFIELANLEKPDMVLFGGDIVDFPSEANMNFLANELTKLIVPYVYTMGNHDWTFPWEYMTPEGTEKYRPAYDFLAYGNFVKQPVDTGTEEGLEIVDDSLDIINVSGDSSASLVELDDLMILSVDDSSNQVSDECLDEMEYAFGSDKPVILMQHVPFSTEKLIEEAKKYWGNPVSLGMQVHGGIAPNQISADLFGKSRDDETNIRMVLAGHVHFPYEEKIGEQTVEIITDAAFKGKFVKLQIVPQGD